MHNNLKAIRESQGMSQRETARALGISQAAYCRYENGRRRLTDAMLLALSEVLSCPVGEILGTGTDDERHAVPDGSLDVLADGLDAKGRDALAATAIALMGLPPEKRPEAAAAVRALARGEP